MAHDMLLERALILVGAMMLDGLIGDPRWLWRHIPHPVVLIGRLIGWLDRRLNRLTRGPVTRLVRGGIALLVVLIVAGAAGAAIWWASRAAGPVAGALIELAWVAVLIAARDLYDHVVAVGRGLELGLEPGRQAVSRIVGRDPESLDASGVARAGIESLAENFSDGVVAPALWYLALGPVGIALYKAINTADSMIGHRSPRYLLFGRIAARLDDVVNLVPARIAGCLMTLAALFLPQARPKSALVTMLRDAGKHRSPNAGWPEAAMAGALDLALAGPRRYGSELVNDPWLGQGRARATTADLKRALALFSLSCVLLGLLALGLGLTLAAA